ncbi:MAG: DUF2061 domain-containing protein [Candidatus Tectomicrobia bacterium]|nr:DUF2061 domain-containing protein [Candidatus Tectomicrobia bacterium]
MDTKTRSWIKSISWRIVGIILLGAIAYSVTGDWKEMTLITLIFHSIRVLMYYYHERLWEHISWGRVKHPLSDLPVKKELTPEDHQLIARKLKELGYIDV